MNYITASTILNNHIFHGEKIKLLMNIIDNPERYIGLFRPTKPRAKILQSLLQSHEIRFGDAMEELIRKTLEDCGFQSIPERRFQSGEEFLSVDQYFSDSSFHYFMEQKVRDDHDSTKKRGQIQNFERKLNTIMKNRPQKIVGIMYFIDPTLTKNKSYYLAELQKMRSFYKIDLHLFYGREFFTFIGQEFVWDDLLSWLKNWKEQLPDFPEIDFDSSPEVSYNELRDLDLGHWRRLLTQSELWDEGIIKALFKNGNTLRLVANYFRQQNTTPYTNLAEGLEIRIRSLSS